MKKPPFFSSLLLIAVSAAAPCVFSQEKVNISAGAYCSLQNNSARAIAGDSSSVLELAGKIEFSGDLSDFRGKLRVAGSVRFRSVSAGWLSLGESENELARFYIDSSSSFTGFSGSSSVVIGRRSSIFIENGAVFTAKKNIFLISAAPPETPGIIIKKTAVDRAGSIRDCIVSAEGSVLSGAKDGAVNLSDNFLVDVSSLSTAGLAPGDYFLTLAKTRSLPDYSGVPSLSGLDYGVWEDAQVSAGQNQTDAFYDLKLKLTYAPFFSLPDGSAYFGTWPQIENSDSPGFTVIKSYELTKSVSAARSIDLSINAGRSFSTGAATINIAENVIFGISGEGTFSGSIKFADTTGVLRVLADNKLTSGIRFPGSSAAGKIEIGDGRNSVTQTVDEDIIAAFGGKVSTVIIKTNSALTIR